MILTSECLTIIDYILLSTGIGFLSNCFNIMICVILLTKHRFRFSLELFRAWGSNFPLLQIVLCWVHCHNWLLSCDFKFLDGIGYYRSIATFLRIVVTEIRNKRNCFLYTNCLRIVATEIRNKRAFTQIVEREAICLGWFYFIKGN